MNTFSFNRNKQDFYVSEAYKTLKTNIAFCGADVKVIAVTSCSSNDGKTDVSWNIALNLAESNKKVLFIDADLRKSVLTKRLGIKQNSFKGLSHFLSGQAEANDVLYKSDIGNLYVIFVGSFPPNPVELLENDRFVGLIKAVRQSFDYIIIDTPPLGSVIDSAIISAVSDGVIFVIPDGKIRYKFALDVKNQLEKSNCRILGVVLNKVDVKEKYKYYKYGYGSKYGYGEKYTTKK